MKSTTILLTTFIILSQTFVLSTNNLFRPGRPYRASPKELATWEVMDSTASLIPPNEAKSSCLNKAWAYLNTYLKKHGENNVLTIKAALTRFRSEKDSSAISKETINLVKCPCVINLVFIYEPILGKEFSDVYSLLHKILPRLNR